MMEIYKKKITQFERKMGGRAVGYKWREVGGGGGGRL